MAAAAAAATGGGRGGEGADEDFQNRWDELERWLAEEHQGFARGRVIVRQHAEGKGERGVFTTGPVAEGELLSSTPLSAILCPANPLLRRLAHGDSGGCHPHNARYAQLAGLLAQLGNPVLSFALLVVFELTQRPRGSRSLWQPYMRILPEHVDTLEWWEARELEELDGEEGGPCWSLGSTAGIRARRTTRATFETTIRPVLDVLAARCVVDGGAGSAPAPALTPPTRQAHPEVFAEEVREEHWRHAFTLITTRSFFIAELGTYGMVPWADMYNHSHTTVHDRKLFSRDRQAFMVHADRAYEADKQIFITYGERLSNPQLLLNFGFIIPDNFTIMPLVRLPPLFFKPDSIQPTRKGSHGCPPSLVHLAASSAHLALEFGGEAGDKPKCSDGLRKLYQCAKAWHSSSLELQLRTSVDSEAHFIEGLVSLMLACRQQDPPISSATEGKPRLVMLTTLRQWEKHFLTRFLASLSSYS